MTTRFERKILTQCAARAMAKFPARSAAAGALFDWLEDADLGIDDLPESDRFRRRGVAPAHGVSPATRSRKPAGPIGMRNRTPLHGMCACSRGTLDSTISRR